VATHGLKGSLVLSHIAGESNWLREGDAIFVSLHKDSFIPFFVAEAKGANAGEYILNLEDINEVEPAKMLIGKDVFIKDEIVNKLPDDSPLLWIGFNIVDKEKGGIGKIEDVVQTGHQWLGKLTYEGREVLIPLIDQLIIEVNRRNKFIRMDLPEGLLSL